MIERELTLRNLSPLALHAERSRAQFTPGLDYIPGSALRGAVAACYLQSHGPDDDFQALFVAGQASFADLLPATDRRAGRLLPATARLCKRYSWDHAQSLTDSLLRLALADELKRVDPLEEETWTLCPEEKCPEYRIKRDRASGYVISDYRQIQRVQTTKRLLTGTSINRATGTTQSGMLFSQEAIEEGHCFRGVVRIAGDDDAADSLSRRLESVLQVGGWLRIGAGRSRGLGLVEIVDWSDPWPGPSLEARWSSFNQAVAALWRRYGAEPEKACFSLTLESHLLLRDEAQWPVSRLEKRADLGSLLGLEGVALKRHVIQSAIVRGWNAQQGLPKEDEPALGRGSVFFFSVETADETAVRQRLAEIEAEGLGRRRAEGFGRVSVCDPFHYAFVIQEMQEAKR